MCMTHALAKERAWRLVSAVFMASPMECVSKSCMTDVWSANSLSMDYACEETCQCVRDKGANNGDACLAEITSTISTKTTSPLAKTVAKCTQTKTTSPLAKPVAKCTSSRREDLSKHPHPDDGILPRHGGEDEGNKSRGPSGTQVGRHGGKLRDQELEGGSS